MQISNAKNIVLNPEAEWSRMMADESERQSLIRYGITLVIVSYVLLFVLSFLFSMAMSLVAPFSAVHVMTSVIVEFALSVASIYIVLGAVYFSGVRWWGPVVPLLSLAAAFVWIEVAPGRGFARRLAALCLMALAVASAAQPLKQAAIAQPAAERNRCIGPSTSGL